MPEVNTYSVILFESASMAMLAEDVAIKSGFYTRLIPTPRHLSSDCGICLKIKDSQQADILSLFKEKRVDNLGAHSFKGSDDSR